MTIVELTENERVPGPTRPMLDYSDHIDATHNMGDVAFPSALIRLIEDLWDPHFAFKAPAERGDNVQETLTPGSTAYVKLDHVPPWQKNRHKLKIRRLCK